MQTQEIKDYTSKELDKIDKLFDYVDVYLGKQNLQREVKVSSEEINGKEDVLAKCRKELTDTLEVPLETLAQEAGIEFGFEYDGDFTVGITYEPADGQLAEGKFRAELMQTYGNYDIRITLQNNRRRGFLLGVINESTIQGEIDRLKEDYPKAKGVFRTSLYLTMKLYESVWDKMKERAEKQGDNQKPQKSVPF